MKIDLKPIYGFSKCLIKSPKSSRGRHRANMNKHAKTGREMVEDVANISDEMIEQLPHWAKVLRDLCREALS